MDNELSNATLQETDQLGVLVVDDDVDILALVNHELNDSYRIFTAENSVEAMEALKKNEIGIALCDERLAGESGSELLAEMKKHYPDVVRVLISGYTDTNAIMNAINKANVFKFIIKPWGKQLKIIVDEAKQYYLSRKKNQYKDSLTSLKSENTILDTLHSEIKRSSRYNVNLSSILVSISNPKKDSALHDFLVDRFLLRRIADILTLELRESDIAGRLRDNKFLVLLTETDRDGASTFLNRLMKRIDQFEQKVNRGLLPYGIITAIHTLSGKQSIEPGELITSLYAQLPESETGLNQ
ncbi:MAG: response regulator [Proteobacteria bacterium]|nr:response regulator [Pseudomonadota bacterium]